MVGDQITIADVYLVVSQVEMCQCLMESNIKNSLNQFNTLFKNCTEMQEFKNRIGTIKSSKSHIKPQSLVVKAKTGDKEIKAK